MFWSDRSDDGRCLGWEKTCTEEKVEQQLKARLKFHKCPVLYLTHAFRRSLTFNTDWNAPHRPTILHSAGSWEDSSPSQLTWTGGQVATSSRGWETQTRTQVSVQTACVGVVKWRETFRETRRTFKPYWYEVKLISNFILKSVLFRVMRESKALRLANRQNQYDVGIIKIAIIPDVF